jgi:hypothetical protein
MKKITFWEEFKSKQSGTLEKLLKKAASTSFGKTYQFSKIKSPEAFQSQVPLGDYASHSDWWGRFDAAVNPLWPEPFQILAKTSGSTNKGSNYFPITKDQLKSNKTSLAYFLFQLKKAGILSWKELLFNQIFFLGSVPDDKKAFGMTAEYMSVYGLQKTPKWLKSRIVPGLDLEDLQEFNAIKKMCARKARDWDIRILSGFPCWIAQIAEEICEINGAEHLKEIWPELKCYLYSGMDIAPYRKRLEKTLQSIPILETYVGTEGFYGYQLPGEPGMRLNLKSGIYFEFLSTEDQEKLVVHQPKAGCTYELVISSNGGLWRYRTRDLISFIDSECKYFKFAGRDQDAINLMGELLNIAQIKTVIQWMQNIQSLEIIYITILPYNLENKIGHAWLVCSRNGHLPDAMELDEKVMEQNEFYAGLRKQDEGLLPTKLIQLEASIFEDFLKKGTGLHTQRKIPLCLPRNQEYFLEIVKKQL